MASTTATMTTRMGTVIRTAILARIRTTILARIRTTMGIRITTTMTTSTDSAALYRLLTWLSPAYPVGAFSYSHGLETAVEEGLVRGRDGLVAYVTTVLNHGAGRIDGALLVAAHRAAQAGKPRVLDQVAQLAAAWRPYIEWCVQVFGAGRCMFESNFPVDKGACSYGALWNAYKRVTSGWSADERAALFHGTATRFYSLGG